MCTVHIEVFVNSNVWLVQTTVVFLYKLTYNFVDKKLTARHTGTINELVETLYYN